MKLWQLRVLFSVSIGQLVSVFTNHVSASDHTSRFRKSSLYFIDVFPERHPSSEYFIIHVEEADKSRCRQPIGYEEGEQLTGLMTVQSFLDGGYDISDPKVLACVKSIGCRRKS